MSSLKFRQSIFRFLCNKSPPSQHHQVTGIMRSLSTKKQTLKNEGVDSLFNHGSVYAKYRPKYPLELGKALASMTDTSELAWDVGTGNGQMAVNLSRHFNKVVGTDVNANQI